MHSRLGRWPVILFPTYRLLGIDRTKVVSPSTDLVIEGFLRCASNFCYFAFLVAQRRPMNVAFHLHVPGQVYRAAKLGIPTLVLIRHPEDAVRSAVVREPYMPVGAFLERYRLFYQGLEGYRDHYVIADFETAIEDFGVVIDDINDQFGTSFRRFEHNSTNLDTVRSLLEQKSLAYSPKPLQSYAPHPLKDEAKRCVDFEGEKKLLRRCLELYRQHSPRMNMPIQEQRPILRSAPRTPTIGGSGNSA